jgi:hypothetical protein
MVSMCTHTENDNHRDDDDDNNHHDHSKRPDRDSAQPPERVALIRWVAGLGAVTAEALAEHLGVSVASARGRLGAAEGERLLQRHRPLAGRPALHTVMRAGLRAAGVRGLDPCHVSASNALHLIECARVAAVLERCYPDHRVQGERELRGEEQECRRALASAELGGGARGGIRDAGRPRHRPDLVLWPTGPAGGLPVAVEVELTVKAPERLAAWPACCTSRRRRWSAPCSVRSTGHTPTSGWWSSRSRRCRVQRGRWIDRASGPVSRRSRGLPGGSGPERAYRPKQ